MNVHVLIKKTYTILDKLIDKNILSIHETENGAKETESIEIEDLEENGFKIILQNEFHVKLTNGIINVILKIYTLPVY